MESLLTASTVYLAGILAYTATLIVTGVVAVQKPPGPRRIYFLLVGVQLSMLIGYIGMHQGWVTLASEEQSLFRFLGYFGAFIALSYLIVTLLELDVLTGVVLAAVLNAFPGLTLLSWVTEGTLQTAITAGVVLMILVAGYLLYGPLNSVSQSASRKRRLVYTKLRNLFFLCSSVLVILAALSSQNAGVTTNFSGQLGATYLDIIVVVGVTYIATSEQGVYDHLASKTAENASEDVRAVPE